MVNMTKHKQNTMKNLITISYKVKGYSNSQSLWGQLQLKNIQSKNYIDNGFNVAEINAENEKDALDLLDAMYSKRIEVINVTKNSLDAYDFRLSYYN